MRLSGLVVAFGLAMIACTAPPATPVPPATPSALPTPTATLTPTPTAAPTPVPAPTSTPTPQPMFTAVRDCTVYRRGGAAYWFIGDEVMDGERLRKFTTARPDYCPAPTATPTPISIPSPMPVLAVPVEVQLDGELIIHGKGTALFTVPVETTVYGVQFAIWDAEGAGRSIHQAEVTFGPATVFSGWGRDRFVREGHDVDESWLVNGEVEVSVNVGPDDVWFIFMSGPVNLSVLDVALVPDPPPYTRLGSGYADGGRALAFLYQDHPDAVKRIRALPWATHGLGPSGSAAQRAASSLAGARQASESLFELLMGLEWVQDEEMSQAEARVISGLSGIGANWLAGMRQLLDMPFLDTYEELDFRALSALRSLTRDGQLEEILAHPTLAGGVTDEHTDIIALMGGNAVRSAGYEFELLDADRVVTVRRTVDLPLQDAVPFSVIWPGGSGTVAKAELTMEIVIDAVTLFEDFMDIPYPQPYVIVMVADLTAARGGGGGSGMISVDPPYHDSEYVLSHEAAHTYWPFWPSWMAEGAATFMDLYYQSTWAGRPLPPPRECDGFDNIGQLEAADLPAAHPCDYSLGSGLFLDLYSTMGHDPFREAFGRLYTWLDDEALLVRCGRSEGKGECYVRAAFVEYMPEHAAVTEEIIDRHFYGVP